MSEAWFCPGCSRYHGPHVDMCPTPPGKSANAPAPLSPWILPIAEPHVGTPRWLRDDEKTTVTSWGEFDITPLS